MARVSATEAARRFSDLLNRVRYQGESFLIERNGEVIGHLGPVTPAKSATVADLVDLLARRVRVDSAFAVDLERLQRAQPKLPRNPWGS